MTEPASRRPGDVLPDVQRRREALRGAMGRLERALASPASGRLEAWRRGVHTCVVELRTAWDDHVAVTEGPGGLFDEVIDDAPRLHHTVERLRHEHRVTAEAIGDLAARLDGPAPSPDGEAEAVRDAALGILAQLARHRHLGADLLYEAYTVDISAGD